MASLRQTFIAEGRGSTAVEFALIAPLLIALLLGIFQVGLGMQNYNALRGASADIARVAVINYQAGERRDEEWLTDRARTIATGLPYALDADRLTATVDVLDDSRVAGALEATIDLQYTIPSVLSMFGMDDITITYSRPVFLLS